MGNAALLEVAGVEAYFDHFSADYVTENKSWVNTTSWLGEQKAKHLALWYLVLKMAETHIHLSTTLTTLSFQKITFYPR